MIIDRWEHGLSWRRDDEGPMRRASHALSTPDGVWIIDPVADEEAYAAVAELGSPAGVISLMDRHLRDGEYLAERLDVPMFVPSGRMRQELRASTRRFDHTIPGAPFEFVDVHRVDFAWIEVALWWDEHRVLAVGDSLGTAAYCLAPGERLAVHPLLRLTPPNVLREFEPILLLVGHGDPLGEDAADAVKLALDTARSQIPAMALGAARNVGDWVKAKLPR